MHRRGAHTRSRVAVIACAAVPQAEPAGFARMREHRSAGNQICEELISWLCARGRGWRRLCGRVIIVGRRSCVRSRGCLGGAVCVCAIVSPGVGVGVSLSVGVAVTGAVVAAVVVVATSTVGGCVVAVDQRLEPRPRDRRELTRVPLDLRGLERDPLPEHQTHAAAGGVGRNALEITVSLDIAVAGWLAVEHDR